MISAQNSCTISISDIIDEIRQPAGNLKKRPHESARRNIDARDYYTTSREHETGIRPLNMPITKRRGNDISDYVALAM